jgi:hypothetical protein
MIITANPAVYVQQRPILRLRFLDSIQLPQNGRPVVTRTQRARVLFAKNPPLDLKHRPIL